MVVGFTTTCIISAYHYKSCEFESRSWQGTLNTTLCDKVCSSSVVFSSFLLQQNWQLLYNWIIVGSGIKHHNPNPLVYIKNVMIKLMAYICTLLDTCVMQGKLWTSFLCNFMYLYRTVVPYTNIKMFAFIYSFFSRKKILKITQSTLTFVYYAVIFPLSFVAMIVW